MGWVTVQTAGWWDFLSTLIELKKTVSDRHPVYYDAEHVQVSAIFQTILCKESNKKSHDISPLPEREGTINWVLTLVPKVLLFVYFTTLGTSVSFDYLVNKVECSNVSTTNTNVQKV